MTKVFESINEWKIYREQSLAKTYIGFVPTMGNLHQGHLSLLEQSKIDTEVTVLSIFLNPTQFDDKKDLEDYPVTIKRDIKMAEEAAVDCLLLPKYDELYPDLYTYRITETNLSGFMEGLHREGHFSGMMTVVLKLLMLVKAHKAYFGEKDFQQLQLVQGMVRAFFIDTEIIAYPTVRNADGLALSSRNSRLTPEQYQLAIQFSKLLSSQESPIKIIKRLEALGIEVDYVEEREGRRFGAIRLKPTRLIDNVVINKEIMK